MEALYLLISLIAFLAFHSTSKIISGARLTPGVFLIFLAPLILWGAAQLSVARYGYVLFYLPSRDFLGGDYIIRWIAFISALVQIFCLPSKDSPRRYLSRQ